MSFFRKIPLGVGGLALGAAGLGNLLAYPGGLFAEPFSQWIRYGFGALAVLALFLFVTRIACDLSGVKKDLQSPVASSLLPAVVMAVILLTIYLVPYAPTIAWVIFVLAAVVQICIMISFAWRFVLKFKLVNVYPSWFVAGVGIQAVAIASPHMDALRLGQIAFWIGFVFYFAILFVVIFRYIKHRPVPEKYQPTIMVFTAPMGICIIGYLSAFPQPSALLLIFMLVVQALSFPLALVALPKLVGLPFYPSHAALGFPTVVNAFAFKLGTVELSQAGFDGFLVSSVLPVVAYLAEALALIVVCYVIARYSLFLVSQLRNHT